MGEISLYAGRPRPDQGINVQRPDGMPDAL